MEDTDEELDEALGYMHWVEDLEDEDLIAESSEATAKNMAQDLADRYSHPHFIHRFSQWKDGKEYQHYGVIAQKHLFNDLTREYGYHLTSLVHPTPPKVSASTRKAMNTSSLKEEYIIGLVDKQRFNVFS